MNLLERLKVTFVGRADHDHRNAHSRKAGPGRYGSHKANPPGFKRLTQAERDAWHAAMAKKP